MNDNKGRRLRDKFRPDFLMIVTTAAGIAWAAFVLYALFGS